MKPHLPCELIKLAVKSGNEFGCRKKDFEQALTVAGNNDLAILGGQVQYLFEDGTCEAYWLSYDPSDVIFSGDWSEYVQQSINSVRAKFRALIASTDFVTEAVQNFKFLKEKFEQGSDLETHLVFILYFISQDEVIEENEKEPQDTELLLRQCTALLGFDGIDYQDLKTYIQHGEYGLAFELMVDTIDQKSFSVSENACNFLVKIARKLKYDVSTRGSSEAKYWNTIKDFSLKK